MSDIADQAAAYQERMNAAAVAAVRVSGTGATHCVECAEPISELRQRMGARRCMDCQSDHELRARVQG
jgi:RNA polymerase-binding transcription factor DksA